MGSFPVRLAAVGLLAVAAVTAAAQPGTIEQIIPQGLRRMSEHSFREAFGLRPGDVYDEEQIRTAFRRLWDMALFSDIVIEAEDGPQGGKVLIVKLKERPILSSVSYEDNKVLTRTQIEDRLKEREIKLALGRPIDMRAVFEAEGALRDYLGEKGFLTPEVRHEVRTVTESSQSVHFSIRPGGKTRIKMIEFKGNQVFSSRRLRKELKLTQPAKWYWPWSGKNLYHPIKWDQDVGAVRDLYQANGYLDIELRPPVVDVIAKSKDAEGDEPPEVPAKALTRLSRAQQNLTQAEARVEALQAKQRPAELEGQPREKWNRKHQQQLLKARKTVDKARTKLSKAERKVDPAGKRWVRLTVPVVEGIQYKTGKVELQGNTVYDSNQLRALVPLREGAILSNAILKLGIDRITRLYENQGYLYVNVVRQIERHEGEPVADVRINVQEDQPYRVDSIEFAGNTATQDRVLRREFTLHETALFSRSKLDTSVAKVNQLGYWESREDPVIEPVENKNAVRVRVAGTEQGRNEIQVGGGYSGFDGAFFTGYYSTRNFLGRGQILSTSLQVGGRRNVYSISFVEPWFMGRPNTLGFSLFRRDTDFGGNLSSSGRGGGIVLGRRLTNFSSIRVNYNFESVTSTGFTLGGGQATNRISSLTPSFAINKVLFPRRPTRGWSFESQVQFAGGFLGGDTNFLKPILRFTKYRPLFRRWVLALHAQGGLVRTFQGDTVANTATVEGVPRSLRFWLGGDTFGPRVFDTRTITPLRFVRVDANGRIVEAIRDPRGRAIVPCPVGTLGFTGAPPGTVCNLGGGAGLDRFDLVELGGDRFYLFQTELVYPVSEQFDVALFLDAGNAMAEDTSFGFDDVRLSTGIEMRFYLPVFPVPLRLIYGVPLKKLGEDRTSSFTFSIGKSF